MKDSDMNIGVVLNDTDYLLHDSWSVGHSRPADDESRNGTYDLKNIVWSPKNESDPKSTNQIGYERKFVTGDVNDIDIVTVSSFSITYLNIIILY